MKKLQRLGTVSHLNPSRNIVLKVSCVPKIGESVVDENLKPVGKVFDIIGPVSAPYAVIRPLIKEPQKLVEKTLYSIPSKGERRRNLNDR